MHPALRSRIAGIDVLESHGGESRVLPSSSVVLGFQYRGRVRARDGLLALAGVTGLQRAAQTYAYEPATGSVLVRFTPAGAACLGVPMHELANRSVPLEALLPRARVAEVIDRLAAARDSAERVAIVEQFLAELPVAGWSGARSRGSMRREASRPAWPRSRASSGSANASSSAGSSRASA